ncbi:toxin-antitoxin system HicB family antitoxin [Actinophytocola xanthii]|uniref:Histidine kinase n=1 Tax=Actinophytocola xanthii TaxID=1912961 RepID=A0A1Q8CLC2_9PSEU|nr:toxin-antitoxin system HicB family antitoxin [Actinophytocola xanthii]OLF15152.1 hypothetical protein BU204_23055 [Actinophytocola xanthii]
MDLTPHVDNLRHQLAVAAEAAGEEARLLAERMLAPIDAATRLTLLTVLSAAAEEITRELAPGSVDVRLRGQDAEFVVSQPAAESRATAAPDMAPPAPPVAPEPDDGATTRLNLRLPESLKARIDEAAGKAGLSANAWLIRVASAALAENERPVRRENSWSGQHYTGWVR